MDGSITAERGLREAIGLASEQRATLHLLHVVDDFPQLAGLATASAFQDTLEHLRRRGESMLHQARSAADAAGVPAESWLRDITTQTVADTIVDEARTSGCDLIVMGTHGRRGVSRLTMGSQAELVLRASPVPVLLVRIPQAPD
jgi:nucleotide-binding universal stress UspA family protein